MTGPAAPATMSWSEETSSVQAGSGAKLVGTTGWSWAGAFEAVKTSFDPEYSCPTATVPASASTGVRTAAHQAGRSRLLRMRGSVLETGRRTLSSAVAAAARARAIGTRATRRISVTPPPVVLTTVLHRRTEAAAAHPPSPRATTASARCSLMVTRRPTVEDLSHSSSSCRYRFARLSSQAAMIPALLR